MLGDAAEADPSGPDLDEEEHVEGTKPNAFHCEQVGGQDGRGVGPKELMPRQARAPGSGPEASGTKDVADARGRDGHAQLLHLALYALIAPPRAPLLVVVSAVLRRLQAPGTPAQAIVRHHNASFHPSTVLRPPIG